MAATSERLVAKVVIVHPQTRDKQVDFQCPSDGHEQLELTVSTVQDAA
jgi:hypothetical protein